MLILLAALAHSAETWSIEDLQPKHDKGTVLVLVTPGYETEAFRPLADFLVKKGRDVRLLSFPCLPDQLDDYQRGLQEAMSILPKDADVVAHGLGATLVLQAGLTPQQFAFLGPVLGAPRSDAADLAVAQRVGPEADLTVHIDQWTGGREVDLTASLAFGTADVATVLLGEDPPLMSCASGPMAATVQSWYRRGLDLELASVQTHTWLAVGLLDRLSPVEITVPTSRAFPDRRLVRLGLTRLDGSDFDHLGLLRNKVAHKAAAKALKEGEKLLKKRAHKAKKGKS